MIPLVYRIQQVCHFFVNESRHVCPSMGIKAAFCKSRSLPCHVATPRHATMLHP